MYLMFFTRTEIFSPALYKRFTVERSQKDRMSYTKTASLIWRVVCWITWAGRTEEQTLWLALSHFKLQGFSFCCHAVINDYS